MKSLKLAPLVVLLVLAAAFSFRGPPVRLAASNGVPAYDHIFFVIDENHSRAQIIGPAPYLTGLANANAQSSTFFAVTHPSVNNYLALFGGTTVKGITDGCTVGSGACHTSGPNISDRINASGRTARGYMESMPSACYVPHDAGPYTERHNPFPYYDQIRTTARCATENVPYSQLAGDLASAATTPNFVWITPNLNNDMHDGSVATGDTWAQNNFPAIFNSPAWKTQKSLLVFTTDEDNFTSVNNIPFVAISSDGSTKGPGYVSSVRYDFYSWLRTIESSWSLPTLTANDAAASPMTDLFLQGTPPPSPSPTPTVSPSPSVSPTPSASPTPCPTPVPTPVPTPTPTPIPTPTPTPVPTPTPTPVPTPSPSPSPVPSPSPSPSVTPSPTPAPVETDEAEDDAEDALPAAAKLAAFTRAAAASCNPSPTPTPPPPSGQLRAAFYYPWFPESWNQQGLNPFTHYTPKLGFYNSSDPAVISTHIAAMQYGNINVGISSWWGQGSPTDSRVPALLSGAAGTGFKWTLYYEPTLNAANVRSDLAYINSHYGTDPSYLHINGKPVVFIYSRSVASCANAATWMANNQGDYLNLQVFGGYTGCASQPDSWHQYGPASRTDAQGKFSYSISPGYWKANEANPKLVRDPAAFATAVRSMVASGATWDLITSFSEWGEGHQIEPSTQSYTACSGWSVELNILHRNGQPGAC